MYFLFFEKSGNRTLVTFEHKSAALQRAVRVITSNRYFDACSIKLFDEEPTGTEFNDPDCQKLMVSIEVYDNNQESGRSPGKPQGSEALSRRIVRIDRIKRSGGQESLENTINK